MNVQTKCSIFFECVKKCDMNNTKTSISFFFVFSIWLLSSI